MGGKLSKLYILLLVVAVGVIGLIYSTKTVKTEEHMVPVRSEVLVSEPPEIKATEAPIEQITVYLTGEVANPDVYTIEKGTRISDLLDLAGGATSEANLETINLAAYLEDASHIIIYKKGEEVSNVPTQPINPFNNDSKAEVKININTASAEMLKQLDGVGDVTAANIIKYREMNGGFETIEDIMNVSRIGDKTFEKLKDYITVE